MVTQPKVSSLRQRARELKCFPERGHFPQPVNWLANQFLACACLRLMCAPLIDLSNSINCPLELFPRRCLANYNEYL